uniref:Uncharacterized protein n=1 Tax=Chromera velia CCMP2878 TaxID=1169474 RepID=A0A0G4GHN0_9ALVE|eukprot:Cvel_667.t1-p1 / transcript=Cvel_667.t1 / gene=Cvel_667 / organism=Chromera_velia_CCMP2878 / gene_product=hypothetical protein / transcript_product=hypothetical protein / location=Cvel_scaffold20:170565-178115(-) / protein_length=929 / sequence_SO=supercontig / SO=protein_coding / is_pseudo=false
MSEDKESVAKERQEANLPSWLKKSLLASRALEQKINTVKKDAQRLGESLHSFETKIQRDSEREKEEEERRRRLAEEREERLARMEDLWPAILDFLPSDALLKSRVVGRRLARLAGLNSPQWILLCTRRWGDEFVEGERKCPSLDNLKGDDKLTALRTLRGALSSGASAGGGVSVSSSSEKRGGETKKEERGRSLAGQWRALKSREDLMRTVLFRQQKLHFPAHVNTQRTDVLYCLSFLTRASAAALVLWLSAWRSRNFSFQARGGTSVTSLTEKAEQKGGARIPSGFFELEGFLEESQAVRTLLALAEVHSVYCCRAATLILGNLLALPPTLSASYSVASENVESGGGKEEDEEEEKDGPREGEGKRKERASALKERDNILPSGAVWGRRFRGEFEKAGGPVRLRSLLENPNEDAACAVARAFVLYWRAPACPGDVLYGSIERHLYFDASRSRDPEGNRLDAERRGQRFLQEGIREGLCAETGWSGVVLRPNGEQSGRLRVKLWSAGRRVETLAKAMHCKGGGGVRSTAEERETVELMGDGRFWESHGSGGLLFAGADSGSRSVRFSLKGRASSATPSSVHLSISQSSEEEVGERDEQRRGLDELALLGMERDREEERGGGSLAEGGSHESPDRPSVSLSSLPIVLPSEVTLFVGLPPCEEIGEKTPEKAVTGNARVGPGSEYASRERGGGWLDRSASTRSASSSEGLDVLSSSWQSGGVGDGLSSFEEQASASFDGKIASTDLPEDFSLRQKEAGMGVGCGALSHRLGSFSRSPAAASGSSFLLPESRRCQWEQVPSPGVPPLPVGAGSFSRSPAAASGSNRFATRSSNSVSPGADCSRGAPRQGGRGSSCFDLQPDAEDFLHFGPEDFKVIKLPWKAFLYPRVPVLSASTALVRASPKSVAQPQLKAHEVEVLVWDLEEKSHFFNGI